MSESSEAIMGALARYRSLITEFVTGAMTADAFETRFLAQYKDDPTKWPREIFEILDGLFFDVDDYAGDPDLRARAGGLDAADLRARAEETLRKLDRYS